MIKRDKELTTTRKNDDPSGPGLQKATESSSLENSQCVKVIKS